MHQFQLVLCRMQPRMHQQCLHVLKDMRDIGAIITVAIPVAITVDLVPHANAVAIRRLWQL